MKQRFIFSILAMAGILISSDIDAQVGIGTNLLDPSSCLQIDFTDKGFLTPRLTTEQRNAIIDPANGLIIFNISSGCPNMYYSGSWYALCGQLTGAISVLHCNNSFINGTLTQWNTASGVTASVPYTGGNGQYHPGQTVGSTGVSGLTATLSPGVFNNGNGNLTYSITGTPASSGTANFAIYTGGQSCNLSVTVVPLCIPSTVTFNYKGSNVTYGVVASPAGNRCWLDRNLGATQVATSSTDVSAYGDLFQWGRLDDGHQARTSLTTTTLSNTDVPGHDNYIIDVPSPFDWRSPQNPELWQGINGTNNPCPTGYRLPTSVEWSTELISWSNNNAEGAFASPLKLTLAGIRYRTDGTIHNLNTDGRYWSSTVSGTNSGRMGFSTEPGTAGTGGSNRAYGFSVRCIRE